ncbi:hypothetical protein CEXT_41191, partial [Caerostris extrusa]
MGVMAKGDGNLWAADKPPEFLIQVLQKSSDSRRMEDHHLDGSERWAWKPFG